MSAMHFRHRLLQRLFWNPLGAAMARAFARFALRFDTVVRNYSLITDTNGERWLNTLLPEAPLVFDVGFHSGDSTAECLERRPAAKVHGFDPSRHGLGCYRARFGPDPRVTFANVALSNAPGTLDFYDYQNMCNSLARRKELPSETPTVYQVKVETLDGYCQRLGVAHIDLLKIDAEGYDLQVLEGGIGLLRAQAVDLFMFEFGSGWAATRRYLWEADEFIKPLRYRLFRLFDGFLCPFAYDIRIDSCTTLPAMYVGVSESRLARGDIPLRAYRF